MVLIASGVLLFAFVHLFPALFPARRQQLWDRIGEGGYKGLFSLGVAAGIVLIVVGWRSTVPATVYVPPPELRHPAMALVVVAFWFMVLSGRPSRVKQWLRHPQLTGVFLWAVSHLAMNGDTRSVVLFGGLALWSLLEIPLINHREGVWIKGDSAPWSKDIMTMGITAVVVVVLMHLHPWFAGMPVLAG